MNTTHSTSAATDILSNELITCSATVDAQKNETTTTSVASNATSSVNALSSPSLFEHAATTAVENAPSPNLFADNSVDMDVTDTEMDNVCIDEDMEVDVLCGDVTFSNVTEDGVVDPPTVGMLFESREAAKLYYLKYVHQQGFSIRIRNSQKRGRGCQDFNETDFVCVREGKRVLPDVIDPTQKTKRNTSTCKCECKARMRVVLKDEEKKWRVMDFCDEHVHRLVSPDKKVLMKTVKVFPKVACVLSEKI